MHALQNNHGSGRSSDRTSETRCLPEPLRRLQRQTRKVLKTPEWGLYFLGYICLAQSGHIHSFRS